MKKNTLQAKKVLLALFAMLIPLLTSCQQEQQDDTVNQEEEKSPGIDYLFDINNRTAKVLGFIGDYPASIDIPSTTDYEGIDYRVTGIWDYAFSGYSNLTAIAIPEEVITIGLAAFENCSNLTSVTCRATIPPTIQSNSFYGVNDSISIHVPKGSVEKYQSAKYWKDFANIRSIVEGTCGDSLTWKLLKGSELIIEGTGDMDDFDAYQNKAPWSSYSSLIQQITLPEDITSIGKYAFYGCNSLTDINIPKGVTSIKNHTFYECHNLTSIAIPEGVTSVGEYAFSGCRSLTTITLPESVTSIGERAFVWCESLTAITILETSQLTSIGEYAFFGCRSLTTINIPEGVTRIESNTFSGCRSLTTITIPASVTSIEMESFYECRELTTINIPESVTSIGERAFYECFSLTSIVIPDGVRNIGYGAFLECPNLKTIKVLATTPPTADVSSFHYDNLVTLYVPATAVGTYKKIFPWSDFKSIQGF